MALRATPEDENVKNPNRRSSDFIISGLTKNQQLTSHFRDRFKTGVGNNSYDRSAAISWMPASYKALSVCSGALRTNFGGSWAGRRPAGPSHLRSRACNCNQPPAIEGKSAHWVHIGVCRSWLQRSCRETSACARNSNVQ